MECSRIAKFSFSLVLCKSRRIPKCMESIHWRHAVWFQAMFGSLKINAASYQKQLCSINRSQDALHNKIHN